MPYKKNKTLCPVCESTNNNVIPYIDFPFYGNNVIDFEKLQICYCDDCGFGYSTPDVKSEVLDKFYSDVYRSKNSPHYINFPRLKKYKISQCQAAIEHLILARHFTNVKSGDCLLDIGPGPGGHFQAALSLLENPKLFALEYNEVAAEAYTRLYGVNTFLNYENLAREFNKTKMNFITSSHSLEHFRFDDLKIILNQMREILHDDGIFVIEVPHVDMRIHAKIRMGDSPHLLFFSKDSLRKILSESGYEVIFLKTVGDHYDRVDKVEEAVKHRLNTFNGLVKFLYTKLTPLWIRKSEFKNNFKTLLAYCLSSSNSLKLSQIKVNYGGNRLALRVVARKK